MTVQAVPSADDLLLNRCRVLMDALAEAQGEMAGVLDGAAHGLIAPEAAAKVACAAARRLASVGELFRVEADVHREATS